MGSRDVRVLARRSSIRGFRLTDRFRESRWTLGR
jgi:hypothetical protein